MLWANFLPCLSLNQLLRVGFVEYTDWSALGHMSASEPNVGASQFWYPDQPGLIPCPSLA